MKKFVRGICSLIDIYIYFVVICCFLTWIPNLNWDFPALKIMFWLAGFQLFAHVPILNMFVPLLMILVLISIRKILYKLIGEDDKFLGYEVNPKKQDDDSDTKQEDNIDDSSNNNGSDTDN